MRIALTTTIKTIITPAILIAAVLLSSCTPGDVGIFYSIENLSYIREEDRGLVDNAPVHSFAAFDDDYFITTPKLRMRIAAAENTGSSGYDWKIVNTPSSDYSFAGKVATDQTDLYVHFLGDDSDGLNSGLFSTNTTTYSSADSVNWSSVTIPDGREVANFFIAEDGQLFITTKNSGLYYVNDDTNTATDGDSDITGDLQVQPIKDVAHVSGNDYLLISSNMVFTYNSASNEINAVNEVEGEAAPFSSGKKDYNDGYGFSGLLQVAADQVYLTSKAGYIYEYDGASWAEYGSGVFEHDGEATAFLDMHDATAFAAGFNQIYAGTENHGYVTLDGSGGVDYYDSIGTAGTNFDGTQNSFVTNVYLDWETDSKLFFYTPANSLWRGLVDNSELTWRKE